jgi:hypothetical protein
MQREHRPSKVQQVGDLPLNMKKKLQEITLLAFAIQLWSGAASHAATTVTHTNGLNQVTLPSSSGTQFFRLVL